VGPVVQARDGDGTDHHESCSDSEQGREMETTRSKMIPVLNLTIITMNWTRE
jgi:hypothetical protein